MTFITYVRLGLNSSFLQNKVWNINEDLIFSADFWSEFEFVMLSRTELFMVAVFGCVSTLYIYGPVITEFNRREKVRLEKIQVDIAKQSVDTKK